MRNTFSAVKIIQRERTVDDRLENFYRFVVERECIRLRREQSKEGPWTHDPILAKGHFCNVRRADDRVTKWIGEHLLRHKKWFWCCVARWINEPRTLEEIFIQHGPWNPVEAKRRMKRINKERNVFRAAYIITGAIAPKGTSKIDGVVDYVLTPLWKTPPIIFPESIEKSWLNLMQRAGMGSFMAGQIVADWQTFGVIDGEDAYEWAPLGPGSNRGLRYIFDKKDGKYSQKEAVELFKICAQTLSGNKHLRSLDLTLHDVQNCLCEFSKYVKGGSKRKFVPHQDQGEFL